MDDPAVAAGELRLVGQWTWALIVLGSFAWEVDGGRLSPGAAVGFGGLSFALWRLARVDEPARPPLLTAAVAFGVASGCTIGPAFGGPVGPVLVALDTLAIAVGLWAALAGLVRLARQLPAIRRRFVSIRHGLRLVAAIGAVLLASYKGWELGGAQPVTYPVKVIWTCAAVVTVLALVALKLWTFRVFMALRTAAEMARRIESSDGGNPSGALRTDVSDRAD